MATRFLVPRNSGEGGIGRSYKAWSEGHFDNINIGGLNFSPDQNVRTTDAVSFISGDFKQELKFNNLRVATLQDVKDQTIEGSSKFIYFSDAVDNLGVSQKTYYETPTPNRFLSGISVAAAKDMRFTIHWDGPNSTYSGVAKINDQIIPFENIRELGTDTRRFEGYLDNINITGQTEITGEANGRRFILPIVELGYGPVPTNIYIDSVENATPKAGEELGETHLKQGDEINVFVEFDTDDVTSIKIHDYGVADEIDFSYYDLEEFNGKYTATIPVTVSDKEGDLSVAVQAINSFGSTGELRESSDYGHNSGIRSLDQTYPELLASDPTSYNGRTDGLRENESTSFNNSISNWLNGTDEVTYELLSDDISINNANDFELQKVVSYEDGIYSNQDNIKITAKRVNNGATDTEHVNVKIANGPVIVSTQMDSLATSSISPHIVGLTEVKAGDTVNSKIEVDGNGVGINDIRISVRSEGISNGSQTSYSSYSSTTLPNGNFEYSIPIKVFGTLGDASRDGNQSASFIARNNFNTLSDKATSTDTAIIENGTIPTIQIDDIFFPASQQAIKNGEFAEFENIIENFDEVEYSSPLNHLLIESDTTYEGLKKANYASGGYNVDIDGGSNNLKIKATKLSNGAVTEAYDIINIANTPLTISINNLSSQLRTSTSATSDNFYLGTSQIMLDNPSLAVDSDQTNPSSLTQTSIGVGKSSNAYSLTITDQDTKGVFYWEVSAINLAGIETTTISTNPTYKLEGFIARTISCSPTSIGAGLSDIGTTVTQGSNVTFENLSEGGSAPNGGTYYQHESFEDGVQLDNSYDINNKFTVCNSLGVTDAKGDHVFNLDKLNRAANTSTTTPATFIVSE